MFCTKCGKELYDSDRFCAFCGAEVRKPQASKNEEVVFNPPFKIEAQKKTEEILRATESKREEAAKRETVVFDWNLEGFPKSTPQKTEDADFNWDSVLEKRSARKYGDDIFFVERSKTVNENDTDRQGDSFLDFAMDERTDANLPKPEKLSKNEAGQREKPDARHSEPLISVEELEKELFGNAQAYQGERRDKGYEEKKADIDSFVPTGHQESTASVFGDNASDIDGDDRFYTFNKKQDEFEELLNKERERVRIMEDEYNRRISALDYTWSPEVFKNLSGSATRRERAKEDEAPGKESALTLVAVVQPSTPQTVDLTAGAMKPPVKISAESIAQADETKPDAEVRKEKTVAETVEKTKLRYSDVFPRASFDEDGATEQEKAFELDAEYFDESEEDSAPSKSHAIVHLIVGILVTILILESVLLTIKLVAPDGRAARLVEDTLVKIGEIFSGESDEAEYAGTDYEPKDSYISQLVADAASDANYIGRIYYNSGLEYPKDKLAYSFDGIASAVEFVDAEWKDAGATYGEKLLEGVVKYYDGWIDTNTAEDLVGINTLEIGEIRTGTEGFYVLCKVTYARKDGGEYTQGQTVFAKISNGLMVINEIKEETL